MRNWRVLSWLLLLCIIFGLLSGVAYADDSFTDSGHGGGWDNSYVDTGLGWYCKSSFLYNDFVLLGQLGEGSSIRVTKTSDGPAICAYMANVIPHSGGVSYCDFLTVVISTVPEFCDINGIVRSDIYIEYNGLRWYYLMSSFSGGGELSTGLSSRLNYNDDYFGDVPSFVQAVLDSAGVTTDPSVLSSDASGAFDVVPPDAPKTHVIEPFMGSPYTVTYRSSDGVKHTVLLDDTYQVASGGKNIVFSDDLNTFNNAFSAVPANNSVLARYNCYRPVSISASEFRYAHVSGDFYFRAGVSGETNLHIYDMHLLVNGERIGSKDIKFYNTILGAKISVNANLPLSVYGDITSLGICASFDGTYDGLQTSSEHGGGFGDGVSSGRSDAPDSFEWYFYLSDNLTIEGSDVVVPSETPVDPIDTIEETTGNIFSWVRDIFNAILDLPKLLLDGIKNLFVPSQDSILAIKAKYENLLAERLGFLWQVKQFIGNFFGDFLAALQGSNDYVFQFPGISFPMNGDVYQLVQAQTVNLNNDFMAVVRPVVGTIVSIVCVLAFFNTSFDMVAAWISGVSYFDFLKRGGGEE